MKILRNIATAFCLATMLASCGSDLMSSKSIDGVEFTGKGPFGDKPYIIAKYTKDMADKDYVLRQMRDSKSSGEYPQDAVEEIERLRKTLLDKDTVVIAMESHHDGKTIELPPAVYISDMGNFDAYSASFKYKMDSNSLRPDLSHTAGLRREAVDSEGNLLPGLGQVLSGVVQISSSFNDQTTLRLPQEQLDQLVAERIERIGGYDHIAKIVYMDDAEYGKLMEKLESDQQEKNAEKAKDNDPSELQANENGIGTISIGAAARGFAKSQDGLYTNIETAPYGMTNETVYSFMNGDNEVLSAIAGPNGKVSEIAISLSKLPLVLSNGKKVTTDMKLADIFKMFGDQLNFNINEETMDIDVILPSKSNYIYIPVNSLKLNAKGNRKAQEMSETFEIQPLQATDIEPSAKVEYIHIKAI